MTGRAGSTPTQSIVSSVAELARLHALEMQVAITALAGEAEYPNGPRNPPHPPIVPPEQMAQFLALRVDAQSAAIQKFIDGLPSEKRSDAAAHFALDAE